MEQIVFMTAAEMARAIREKQISAVEALEAHIQQIARHNPKINAIITIDEEGARRRAREADAALASGEVWGPLHGVPVAVKDTWETSGMRTTASFPPLKDYVPQQDATVVARLKGAGAIVFGKTNMPQMAMEVQTDSPLFGRANNPWDLDCTVGGSTGGGAAALAAGLSALEIGSDLGGSVRIPAHFCGVFGIKTTNRRIPASGHIPPLPGSHAGLLRDLISIGPIARSVSDLRLALELLAKPDGRQTDLPPVPLQRVQEKKWTEYRIAWCDEMDVPVQAEIRAAVANLVSDLEQLGASVEFARPDYLRLADVMETYGEFIGAGMAASGSKPPLPGWLLRLFGYMEKSSPMARGYLRGMGAGLNDYAQSLARRDAAMLSAERFFTGSGSGQGYDAWLLPVTSTPAFQHVSMKAANSIQQTSLRVDGFQINYMTATSAYVCPFNITGQPVVVIPIGKTKAGLPMGVQIAGRRWSDEALLALAEKISREVTGPFCPPPRCA
jgi:amidase